MTSHDYIRRVYHLIELYISERISDDTFCDDFYYSHELNIDHSTLTALEREAFAAIGDIAERFTNINGDRKPETVASTNSAQLRKAVIEASEALHIPRNHYSQYDNIVTSDNYIHKIYRLIAMYVSGRIADRDFCDKYYDCYNLNISDSSISGIEREAFANISKIVDRFSEYEEDHRLDDRAFTTSTQLRQVVLEASQALNIRTR
jgi:hypothetical protein